MNNHNTKVISFYSNEDDLIMGDYKINVIFSEDNISLEVKEERLARLNKLVGNYANMNNQKYLDQVVEVLVDGFSKKNDTVYSGYTPQFKLVNFTAKNVKIGDIVKVKIIAAKSFSLDGVMIEEE